MNANGTGPRRFGDYELDSGTGRLLRDGWPVISDAVVDYYNLAGAVAVRVGVFFGWAAVGGPAGVADTVGAFDRGFRQDFFEIAEFAGCAAYFELAFFGDYGNSGGVVAAVFEFTQALNYDRDDFFGSDIADNSAHAPRLLELEIYRKSVARSLRAERTTLVPCAV